MAGCRPVAISSRCSAQATAHILFESKAKYLYISEDAAVQRLATSARAHIQEFYTQSPIYATGSAAASSSGIVQFQLPNYTALYNAYDDGDIRFQQRLDTIASLTRRSDAALILHTSGKMLIIYHDDRLTFSLFVACRSPRYHWNSKTIAYYSPDTFGLGIVSV
jgi:long-subunit acyl-CoA synthetase (AMP-forming)